ncbi:YlbE-like family protein [Mesobacillus zeae]|uniref:YlbE-like protein n=1 Tax=Mesobacillus zeae TaxID=1917180 RepID=A0A398BCH2_9BACI|nr:YlbE-like family protein [Mesobacillus zeae]RID87879.1 hypothetical protein D1970_03320 [Mesobacillus zeae]
MRKEVLDHIRARKDLQEYIRIHPYWYRKLSRDPRDLYSLEIAALHYHERTIPHHVQKFTTGVQMASMMMGMLSNMQSQGGNPG